MYQKFKKLYEKIKNPFDLDEISKVISEFILREFEADGCEIKCLGEDDVFFRIHFALSENGQIIHDQEKIEKRFGVKETKYLRSLIGHAIQEETNYLWPEEAEGFRLNFIDWVKTTLKPIDKVSALRYNQNMPGGRINNFLVLPIQIPRSEKNYQGYPLKGCIHIFNLCNGSREKKRLESARENLLEIYPYISLIVFNAIFYNRAKDEIDINNKIEQITSQGKSIQEVLEKIISEFAGRLHSPLSTVWFPDIKNQLLVLHSYHIKTQFLNTDLKIGEEDIKEAIEKKSPKWLRVDDSISGRLMTDTNCPWIKIHDISGEAPPNYKWEVVIELIHIDQFIALPIKDAESIIAILVFHPNIPRSEFQKISINYFKSYTTQVATTLKYFMERNFSLNAKQLSEKLTQLVNKREERFYHDLVEEINNVIDAEACSVFEVRGGDESVKGIYLIATTDKSEEAHKKIGQKIYEINSQSITGHVALTGESIIVYDVTQVNEFYPEITSMSGNFMEQTARPHKSYIAVPIPAGISNYDDRGTSVLIVRCINKKAGPDIILTELFTMDDKHLLNYVGAILESFRKVVTTVYERNDLLDLIIHEIENPIVSIRGTIDTIMKKRAQKSLADERLKQKLDNIDTQALLLKSLMKNTVFLNQLQQGRKLPVNRKNIHIWKEIIANTLYWMTPHLKNYNLFPVDIIKEDIDPLIRVNADGDHLTQVFYNLIINALKYAKPGEIPRIAIAFKKRPGEMAIMVKDWGVGIEENHSEKIFERGFRSQYARKSHIKGKGFGLWLCRELLKYNGISIRVSRCKEPTIFEVIIPREYCNYL